MTMRCSASNTSSPLSKHRAARAFTLVELLVVMAIISLLVGLLLPAIQAAREAARRMQCSNNLKQTGLAMHQYHDTYQCFPPGNVSTRIASSLSGWTIPTRTNWAIELLPYLELGDLYNSYNHNVDNPDSLNMVVIQHPVSVYSCPSDTRVDGLELPLPGFGYGMKYHKGSYRGMAGRCDLMYTSVSDHGLWVYSGFWQIHRDHPGWRGVFHVVGRPGPLSQCESIDTILDGTSNTIAVGERHGAPSFTRYDTLWANSRALSTSQAAPISATLRAHRFLDCVATSNRWKDCTMGWGSYHPDGGNWLLCDGSVRYLSATVNVFTFCEMASIAGGEAVQVPK